MLTYRWDPNTSRLTLTANDATGTVTRPVLAAQVSFTVDLQSSKWQYDTTNRRRDHLAGVGRGRPSRRQRQRPPDGQELAHLDLVQISMTVLDGARAQTYETRVDLRNRN